MLFVPKKKARRICRRLIEESQIELKKEMDEAYEEYKKSKNNTQ